MNLSKEIIEGLQDAREAKTMARDVKSAVDSGFKEIKDSFRYDMQNIINTNIKIAVIDALKEHYQDKIAPLEKDIDDAKAANIETQRQLDRKANMGYGFAAACSIILGFLGFK